MQDIGVSVVCMVYNHERFLRRCLDSLVGQKTNFRYTVIVHDDASTDGSREIIKEYEKRYPDIICPIYQEENQYSKYVNIAGTFVEPKVHSKYVAYCEGDDYWSSENKLQRQYDVMEEHPECGACLHRTVEVSENEMPTGIQYPEQIYKTELITAEELFASFVPRMFQTTSYFFRAELWHNYMKNPPLYKEACDIGDVPLMLYFGSKAKVFQINEELSCYRRGAASSWSNAHIADEKKMIKHNASMVDTYLAFNEDTNGAYQAFKDFFVKNNSPYRKALPFMKRLTVFLGLVFPGLVKKMYFSHTERVKETELKKWYDAKK